MFKSQFKAQSQFQHSFVKSKYFPNVIIFLIEYKVEKNPAPRVLKNVKAKIIPRGNYTTQTIHRTENSHKQLQSRKCSHVNATAAAVQTHCDLPLYSVHFSVSLPVFLFFKVWKQLFDSEGLIKSKEGGELKHGR